MTTLTLFVDGEQINLKANGRLINDVSWDPKPNQLAMSAFNHQLELLDIPILLELSIRQVVDVPDLIAKSATGENYDRPITIMITAKRLPHPTKKPQHIAMYYRKVNGMDNPTSEWGDVRYDDLNFKSDSVACVIDLDYPMEWVSEYPTTNPAGLVDFGMQRLLQLPIWGTIDITNVNYDENMFHPNLTGQLASDDPRIPIALVRLQNRSNQDRRIQLHSLDGNFALQRFTNGYGDFARITERDEPLELISANAVTWEQGGYTITVPANRDAIICPTDAKIVNAQLPPYGELPTVANPRQLEVIYEFHTWKNASIFYRATDATSQGIAVGKYSESINPKTLVSEYGFFLIFPKTPIGSGPRVWDIDTRLDPFGAEYFRLNDISQLVWEGDPDVALAPTSFTGAIVANRNSLRSGTLLYVPEGSSAALYMPWNAAYNHTMNIVQSESISAHLSMAMMKKFDVTALADQTWSATGRVDSNLIPKHIQPWPQKTALFPELSPEQFILMYGFADLVLVEGLQTIQLKPFQDYPNWRIRFQVYLTADFESYLGKANPTKPDPIFDLMLNSEEVSPVGYTISSKIAFIPLVATVAHANKPLTIVVSSDSLAQGWSAVIQTIKGNPI